MSGSGVGEGKATVTGAEGSVAREAAPLPATILWRAVLVGLTPLLPLPWVDDVAKGVLERRLALEVSSRAGRPLGGPELQALTEERSGCLPGCVGTLVVYPVKRLFRKIFFVLEIKRSVDLVSRAYHLAFLLDAALREGWLSPGDVEGARAFRGAVREACDEVGVTPVERSVRETLAMSKGTLRAAARLLERSLRGRRTAGTVSEAVEEVEPREEVELRGTVARLQVSLGAVPREHFDRLRSRTAEIMASSRSAATPGPGSPEPGPPGAGGAGRARDSGAIGK